MLVGHKLLADNFRSLVEDERLAHAYLFFGPEGVGKKLFALTLANFLEKGEFDYGEKFWIFSSGGGSAFGGNDAILVQPNESKTIGIDEARRVKEFLYMKPNVSSKRTVIIDEAEFLTTEAQNALLKITEEPPESSLLILIARDPEILMPTTNSRLQKVYFSSLSEGEVVVWLMKEHSVSKTEAEKLAKDSFGSPGLALKMLNDKKFQETMRLAKKFLGVSGAERKDFLKILLESDEFNMLSFLDAVILISSLRIHEADNLRKREKEIELWHKLLGLRRDFSNFSLNPKLQLLSL
ncbi:MAG: DNA polymerase III, delta prime subunit [Parcubacteria group bacterium Gr01-1014_20]|nr:MAG: DNA polymerase III, delta prime subunit [Parcubacteria group bacterium Gr01-1014_20]